MAPTAVAKRIPRKVVMRAMFIDDRNLSQWKMRRETVRRTAPEAALSAQIGGNDCGGKDSGGKDSEELGFTRELFTRRNS